MNRLGFFILALICLLASCKSAEIGTGTKLRKRSVKQILKQLEKQRIEFQYFEAKAKAKVESPEQNISFSIKLRMRKDSLIWLTAKKVSVEGLRVQMTPDRIEVLNRQDQQYLAEPFSSIKKQLAIPLDIQALEDLLIGNPILYEEVDFKLKMDSLHYILSGPVMNPSAAKEKLGTLELRINSLFQIEKIVAEIGGNSIDASFENYKDFDGHLLPQVKDIRVYSPESGNVRMKITFTKLKFDQPFNARFSIPNHYEKIINGYKQD